MAEALEAGYDLGGLALCFVALALLVMAKDLVQAIAKPLEVSILGYHPFRGIATALENTVVSALDSAIKGVERLAARFLSGLIDAFGLVIGLAALVALGTKDALVYLWNTALTPRIRSLTNPIKTTAEHALSEVQALEGTVASNLDAAERYAREHASSALSSAEAYATHELGVAVSKIDGELRAAVAEAESYADVAVSKLRAAEDAAVAGAVSLAVAAKVAGEQAAAKALGSAEAAAGELVAAEAATRAAAIAQLDAAGKAALGALDGLVVDVEDEIHTIEGQLGAAGTAALIGSIPALATLVHAIATEAGLENADCRQKVKGICGTNASAWTSLLEGLAATGLALSLGELARIANGMLGELEPLIREAA